MGLRIIDCYFERADDTVSGVDIVRTHQVQQPIPGAHCTPFSTLVLDLTCSESAIFSGMKGDVRRLIRKAEKDGVSWESVDTGDAAKREAMARFFDRCRSLKRLPPVSRSLLDRLARYRCLAISVVRSKEGEILAANSFVVTPRRARSIYTAAVFREPGASAIKGLVARAGRLMWWNDALYFQRQGVLLFDFGGCYLGQDDPEKSRVGAYKAEFGGELRQEFDCEQAGTVSGRLALWALHQVRARQGRKRVGQRLPAEAAS